VAVVVELRVEVQLPTVFKVSSLLKESNSPRVKEMANEWLVSNAK